MKRRFAILIILLFTLIVSACGNAPTPTPVTLVVVESATPASMVSETNTPDLCAKENIQAEVQKVHKLMREFDDSSSLAASVPADQLTPVISNLQRIRRDAEDLPIPPCLVKLKTHEINHMNLVIGTLINLIGYSNGTVSKDVIDQGIALARQEHDNYTIELATVLGLTPVVATPAETPTLTPAPQ
jgi:hypothetical protein